MANLRFPSDADTDGKPFMTFTAHRASYNRSANNIQAVKTGEAVTLYLPPNYNISDSFNYQTEATGLVGAATEAIRSGRGSDIGIEDVSQIAKAGLTNKQSAAVLAGLAGGAIGAIGGKAFGALLAGGSAGAAVGNVAAEISTEKQVALNPREFMLFKSPNIRTFSFTFNLIPSNEKEANDIPKIIKFFRKASYPELHTVNAVYNFPEAFTINIGNSNEMIKIPEVFCEGVNVTYNPTSMSYLEINNMPVEVNIGLSFKELVPIHKDFVEQGY